VENKCSQLQPRPFVSKQNPEKQTKSYPTNNKQY
jgi:hypothetical protein